MPPNVGEVRDSIENIWGDRTPYKHEWPTRCDASTTETPDKWVQSACVLCSNGCGLDIGVKDGRVIGVRGRVSDRVNKGRLGPKGLNGWSSIHHPDRLKTPLIRRENGQLEPASWDEAMSLIAEKAKATIDKLTRHGIGFYTSGQLFLEEYYVLAMIGKAGLNTLHMDGNTRLCTATAAASMRESFGSDGQPGSYTDIDYTDCLFLVGHNVAATQTVLWARMLDRLEGPNPPKLIVVDPRESETAKRATIHLRPKTSTNLALLNGLQHLLFKNNWVNTEYATKYTVGVDELREVVSGYTPDVVEKITGVPAQQLEAAAEILGKTPSLLSTALQGVYQSSQATASACQINNINLLLGHIGKPGSGILQMNGQPTAQNNRETGCDGEYPGFRNFQNKRHMQEIADAWNIDLVKMPHWNQPTHIENMLKFIADGSIGMFWISGTNPMVSLPNLARVRKLFTKPELFVVCQDIFPTETTAIADVVLPAAQWGEKTGCFTNVDRTMHLSHKAVEPPGEARADLDIFLDFARRMEFKDKHGGPLIPYKTPEEIFNAWKKMSYGRPCDCSALTYDKLTGGSGIQWPCTDTYPNGKERLFDDGKFFTDIDYCEDFGHDLETGAPLTRSQYESLNPAGRAILKACHYRSPLETINDEFPLRLSTGRNVFHFHTRTKTGRSKRLHQAYPEPKITVSPADAENLQLTDGEMVVVRSRRGAIQLPVTIGEIHTGDVFIPFHFGTLNADDERSRAANELTLDEWDPVSKQPRFKTGAVRIEKCVQKETGDEVQAKEMISQAAKQAATKVKQEASQQAGERVRRLEVWLGATHEGLETLLDIYKNLLPRLVNDSEVHSGVRELTTITTEMLKTIRPLIERYHESRQFGRDLCHKLREAMFPKSGDRQDPCEALSVLQSLQLFVSYVEGHLVALTPTSQALWDDEFIKAVDFCTEQLERQKAWIKQQVKVRGPQTLLVPIALPGELQTGDTGLEGSLRGSQSG
ncbi:Uncharacterized protein PECH_007245 [Penicillium ucsense]|uniref:4Fe-4S Mo/W bis-MGD-type domain-containing protein n=1 Tax=Penicillium ucsense TaxID=2839758 RepID=A0A8J8VYZ1_9EURO|nr:Uncharacterized protein PECM_001748 [Penicillium ucsense]KAF7735077.1 Uncharacterized protein PECH_007245 [Penicillium ucsense]